eukprot:166027-Prymnesium_polylepis.3
MGCTLVHGQKFELGRQWAGGSLHEDSCSSGTSNGREIEPTTLQRASQKSVTFRILKDSWQMCTWGASDAICDVMCEGTQSCEEAFLRGVAWRSAARHVVWRDAAWRGTACCLHL